MDLKIGKVWILGILLIVSVGVRLPGLVSRTITYDESITLLETAGHAGLSPLEKPTLAGIAKKRFVGTPTPSEIATVLRQSDIHPPVYYWLLSFWRRWLGSSLETARIFSLLCSTGTVLALYLLLQAGKFERPVIPSLIFSISSGAVLAGHLARSYALASLLTGMSALFAYLASEANGNRFRLALCAIAMALCSATAFQTNYLTLFPASVILLWFLICLWPVSRLAAVLFPLATVSIWFVEILLFPPQLGVRPQYSSGSIGIFPEIAKIFIMNLLVLWRAVNDRLGLVFIVVLSILIGSSAIYVWRHWSKINRKLLLLVAGLAFAPAAGILLLDLLFNKNLPSLRYYLLAGPGMAVICTYGITKQHLTRFLLIVLIGLQLLIINWGREQTPGWQGSDLRSIAGIIKDVSSHPYIVIIGAGYGRGHPASVIYELDPETMIIVVGKNSNLKELQSDIQRYDEVWILPSSDGQTAIVENELLNRLRGSGRYTNVSSQRSAIRLWN